MFLMLKDKPVVWFDTEDYSVVVLENNLLPPALVGRMKGKPLVVYDNLRHFFANRVLSISRHNAKAMLQSIGNSQRLTEEESFRLSLSCRGVSVSDSYWIKGDNEQLKFIDVNIRNNSLSDVVFDITMKGTPVSLQRNLLAADISTQGMFRKCWVREEDGLYLYKSDKTNEYLNTKMELEISEVLDLAGVNSVRYQPATRDGIFCCKSKCFTNDTISFVEAELLLQDYSELFTESFANMVVTDYVIANPDRHNSNWGYLYNTDTAEIFTMAPLFDHNQAGIALLFGKEKEFEELLYPPTGLTIRESVQLWLPKATVDFSKCPEPYSFRYKSLF